MLAGAIGMLVAFRPGHGQPKSKIPRIGILWFGSMDAPTAARNRAVFRQRLAALGCIEGKNLVIEQRSADGNAHTYVTDAMEAGRKFNLSIAVSEVGRAEDFPNAFAMIRDMRPDAVLVMGDPFLGEHRSEVLAFAATARLPAAYDLPNMAREGGLVAYGPLLAEHYVAGAGYVDRILKGARPADLPVEQPTRFELVINLKAAKALGLTIPQSIIVRADEVIQ